jgi:hypothetical protein
MPPSADQRFVVPAPGAALAALGLPFGIALAAAGRTVLPPFLSVHPAGAERAEAMRRLAEGEPGQAR